MTDGAAVLDEKWVEVLREEVVRLREQVSRLEGAPGCGGRGIPDAVRLTVASRVFQTVAGLQPDMSYAQMITKSVSLTKALEREVIG